MSTISLPVRYYRQRAEPDPPEMETNSGYIHETIPLPPKQTALVLVDCWDDHPEEGEVERMEPVLKDRIAPVLTEMRSVDTTIIHWPAPYVARNYPEWTNFADEYDLGLARQDEADNSIAWPPRQFSKALTDSRPDDPEEYGEYSPYTKAPESGEPISWDEVRIHPAVSPEFGEDEFLVGNYEQIHRLLAYREILHLVFVGFHTNMCIRNHMEEMRSRGFNQILLRDCTLASETHDTIDDELHKKIAIREMESGLCYSTDSEELLSALS